MNGVLCIIMYEVQIWKTQGHKRVGKLSPLLWATLAHDHFIHDRNKLWQVPCQVNGFDNRSRSVQNKEWKRVFFPLKAKRRCDRWISSYRVQLFILYFLMTSSPVALGWFISLAIQDSFIFLRDLHAVYTALPHHMQSKWRRMIF